VPGNCNAADGGWACVKLGEVRRRHEPGGRLLSPELLVVAEIVLVKIRLGYLAVADAVDGNLFSF